MLGDRRRVELLVELLRACRSSRSPCRRRCCPSSRRAPARCPASRAGRRAGRGSPGACAAAAGRARPGPGTRTPYSRTGLKSMIRPVQLISQPTTAVKTRDGPEDDPLVLEEARDPVHPRLRRRTATTSGVRRRGSVARVANAGTVGRSVTSAMRSVDARFSRSSRFVDKVDLSTCRQVDSVDRSLSPCVALDGSIVATIRSQVLQRGELDGDPALVAPQVDLDPGVVEVGEPVGEVARAAGRSAWRRAAGRRLVLAELPDRDDLLEAAHRDALGDDPRRPAGPGRPRPAPPSSVRAWPADSTPAATRRCTGGRELEQPQGVADLRPAAADAAGQLLVGAAEVVEQLLVGGRLLQRVQLGAVQVLQQRVAQQRRRRRSPGRWPGSCRARPPGWRASRRSPMISS